MASQDPHAPGEQGGPSGHPTKDAAVKGKQRFLRLSKKLKKAPDPIVMDDLPPDAPPINCPPPYEGYLSMKPYKKRRISVAKRYCAKLSRGLLKLTSGKSQRLSYECLASEYTIDLSNVVVKIDDTHRRIIIVYKSEAHQLTPVYREEYEKWKDNIRKHRLFRQSFRRQRKEEVESEPLEPTPLLDLKLPTAKECYSIPTASNQSTTTNKSTAQSMPEGEGSDLANILEECRNMHTANTELYEKLTRLFDDMKIMTTEMKGLHLEFKATIQGIPAVAKLATIDYLKTLTTITKSEEKRSGSASMETSESESSEESSDKTIESATGSLIEKKEKVKEEKRKELKKEEKTEEEKRKDEKVTEEKKRGERTKEERNVEDKIEQAETMKDNRELTIEMPVDLRTATEVHSTTTKSFLTIPTASDLMTATEKMSKEVKQEEKRIEKSKELPKLVEKIAEKTKEGAAELITVQKTSSSTSLAPKLEKKTSEELPMLSSIVSFVTSPRKKRRERLPREAIASEELGIRTLLQIAAKRIPIPISYFEPLSMAQAICEELRYADKTLNKAALSNDPLERQALVTAFAVSGYSAAITRKQKPFNPLLGETYDYSSESGWRYHAEQVSHHPPVLAAHADGRGWTWWQTFTSATKISWTGTAEVSAELCVRLRIGKDHFSWNKVKLIFENASAIPEHRKLKAHGTMLIRCTNGFSSIIVFNKDKKTEITGSLINKSGIHVIRLNGYWDRYLRKADGTMLFEAIPPPKDVYKYYGFSQFACGLNELCSNEKAFLPPTDSRLRPDVRALEMGDAVKAAACKAILEKVQRTRSEQKHKRLWFEQQQDSMTYTTMWFSNGKYWTSKEKQFKDVPDMLQLFT